MLCDHGCGNEGLYYSKNTKRWRCTKHANHCPSKAAKTGLAIKQSFSKIDPLTGKTSNEARLEKIRETRKTKIDKDTGLPLDVARAYKAHRTKNIVKEDGTTIQQTAAARISKTKKGSDNTRLAGIKAGVTMKNTMDPTTGLSIKETAVQKRLITMSQIEENGLSKMENSISKSKFRGFKMKIFRHFNIYYQGNNELNFLKEQYKIYNDDLEKYIKRGKSIRYYDPTRSQNRMYFPDFIINETILYEIKSKWTWNNNIENSILHRRNIAKLDTAKEIGFEVHLILDNVNIIWP